MKVLHKHLAIIFTLFVLGGVECSNATTTGTIANGTYDDSTIDGTYTKPTCLPYKFTCLNGNCIRMVDVCDGINDCDDWSDENNELCNITTACPSEEFTCTNGVCVNWTAVCNKYNDCGDWSDEINCGHIRSCTRNLMPCPDRSRCITTRDVCNGFKDCTDGSDELNCRIITRFGCYPGMFVCENGYCISRRSICNGRRDCTDGSDESNCGIRNECSLGTFACRNGGRCIIGSSVCDGFDDCGDRSDEYGCRVIPTTTPACLQGQFTCWNRRCINFRWVCDGYDDCGDGSDEIRCGSGMSSAGIVGTVIACSALIVVLIIGLLLFRKRKQQQNSGVVVTSQPFPGSIPLHQLSEGAVRTTTTSHSSFPAQAITEQHVNLHPAVANDRHEPQQNGQPQSRDLYPSLPHETHPAVANDRHEPQHYGQPQSTDLYPSLPQEAHPAAPPNSSS